MIRSYFGISRNPFSTDDILLLSHQQEVYDILKRRLLVERERAQAAA